MTPEEHDLLSRMDERLEFIQGKVSAFCAFKDSAAIDIAMLKEHCEAQKDLPIRVSSLEKFRWLSTGALIVLGVLIGWGWLAIGGAK